MLTLMVYRFAEWNLPLFDGTATASVLADKKLYPTLTRLSMDLGRNLQFFKIMMDTFHWSTAVVIHDQNDPIWKAPVAGLDKYFERFRKTINVVRIPITTTTDSLVSYKYALQLMNRTARGNADVIICETIYRKWTADNMSTC